MIHSQEHPIRLGRYCVSALHAHLVFVTKYRRKVFNNEILIRLEQILREACNDFEVELKEFVGEKDHIYLLLEYPPKVQLSKLINSLKGVSSRLLRQEFLTYGKGRCGVIVTLLDLAEEQVLKF